MSNETTCKHCGHRIEWGRDATVNHGGVIFHTLCWGQSMAAEAASLREIAVAAQAAYDALAGLFVASHPQEPMGTWVAELRDLGNALVGWNRA